MRILTRKQEIRIFAEIYFLITLYFALMEIVKPEPYTFNNNSTFSIILLLVNLVVAIGLWTISRWGRILALVISPLYILFFLLAIVSQIWSGIEIETLLFLSTLALLFLYFTITLLRNDTGQLYDAGPGTQRTIRKVFIIGIIAAVLVIAYFIIWPGYKNAKFNEWYSKARKLELSGQYEEAIKAYDKAIGFNPRESLWHEKASAYSKKHDKANALRCLGQAIKEYSGNNKEAKKDDTFKWLWDDEDFKKVTGPTHDDLEEQGRKLAEQGNYNDAIKAYDKALELCSANDTSAFFWRGHITYFLMEVLLDIQAEIIYK